MTCVAARGLGQSRNGFQSFSDEHPTDSEHNEKIVGKACNDLTATSLE